MTHRSFRPSALALWLSTFALFGAVSSPAWAQPLDEQGVRSASPLQTQPLLPPPARVSAPVQAPAPAAVSATLRTPQGPIEPGIMYSVQSATQRLEMIVNTSRILTLEQRIPTAQVGNRELLDLTALSPSQIQVFAKKAGVTQINLWNEQNQIRTIDVVVYGDSRELKLILESQFPRASLTVTPLANSVIVGGFVDKPDQVNKIIRIAEDYHPNIINNITVGGVQQVLLDVKVMEVSRTKLRALGIDLAHFSSNDYAVSSISGLINAVTPGGGGAGGSINGSLGTFTFGVVNPNSSIFGIIDALAQNNVAKILAEPKLVTVSGRPARFQQGGEFPVLIPQSLGTVSIEYRPYGTELDFVPIVMGNGVIRLELRPRVSEPDPALSITINGTTVPALTTREVDTGVEMRAGQTLAIAGLLQTRVQTEKTGLPWIKDVPYVGVLFSRKQSVENEVETLILVTPHLVDAMDCHEVPPCGPGSNTTFPNDVELYLKNYVEVPRCCPPHDDVGIPMGPGPGMQPGHAAAGSMPPQSVEHVAPPRATPPQRQNKPAPRDLPRDLQRDVPPPEGPQVEQPRVNDSSNNSGNGRPVPSKVPAAPAVQSRPEQSPAAVRRATPAQLVPAHSVGANSSNRPSTQDPPEPNPIRRSTPTNRTPGFIGPTGYDVQ